MVRDRLPKTTDSCSVQCKDRGSSTIDGDLATDPPTERRAIHFPVKAAQLNDVVLT